LDEARLSSAETALFVVGRRLQAGCAGPTVVKSSPQGGSSGIDPSIDLTALSGSIDLLETTPRSFQIPAGTKRWRDSGSSRF
jgi:hypothetical protein